MVEQRVIGQKIGARPATPAVPVSERSPEPPAPAGKKKRRRPRKLVVVIVAVVVVLGVAAAAYLMLGKSSSGGAPEPKPTPTPVAGQVVQVDAVSVNLAGGHYLRLGLALQLSTDATKDKTDTARALDLAIALYSGRSVDEVSQPASREQLKTQLLGELQKAYGPEVMDVYLTDYVTQ
ncbi:MAG TPA: flagellar basal body-associated FliL family protein [Cellulomonas sp.]